jgi:hypothetical protein
VGGYSITKVQFVVNQFIDNKVVIVNDAPRGGGAESHKYHKKFFSEAQRKLVRDFRLAEHQAGRCVTVRTIQQMLNKANPDDPWTCKSTRLNLTAMGWSHRRIDYFLQHPRMAE